MFKAYHAKRGEAAQRRRVIVPDSAHGTNPASAAMCGYQVTTVRSDARGNVDLEALKGTLGPDVAGFMLTNPNTLGLFEERVREVCAAVHDAGGLVYGDGANMNALLGVARPGDLGFDCVHINVHKTFSTPHGAGGPGAGPLCVKALLRPFLPKPWIVREADGTYHYDTAREDRDPEPVGDSIGSIKQRLGNFGVLVRAYTYMKTLGEDGLAETGRDAVLAANYLLALVRDRYDVAYDRTPMHEFVLSAAKQKKQGASALDIAKALLDEGFHSPTVYFPLIVPEALMVEPTETEPKETLDAFAAALVRIADQVARDPAAVRDAPKNTPLRHLDEVGAARRPVLRWQCDEVRSTCTRSREPIASSSIKRTGANTSESLERATSGDMYRARTFTSDGVLAPTCTSSPSTGATLWSSSQRRPSVSGRPPRRRSWRSFPAAPSSPKRVFPLRRVAWGRPRRRTRAAGWK